MAKEGLTPIDRVLPGVLSEIVLRQPLSPEKLAFAWRATVGPAIGRASCVSLADGGTLEVRVETEDWRRELKRSSPLIVERLRTMLGDGVIKRIRVISREPRTVRRPRR